MPLAADECERESDASLLRRIAERDFDAFALLYRRYAGAVYGLALRQLHDFGDAEEATRRTFAAIWTSAASYVSERGDGARWVFAVARQTIGRPGEPDDGWEAFRVHAAVATLPEQERAPLELAYWGGRGPVEIAELLGLPLSTVVIRTRTGLARLAARLDGAP